MAEVRNPQCPVIIVVLAFLLHAAEPHANPRVQFLEDSMTGGKERGEVIRRAPDDPIQFRDHVQIKIMVPRS